MLSFIRTMNREEAAFAVACLFLLSILWGTA